MLFLKCVLGVILWEARRVNVTHNMRLVSMGSLLLLLLLDWLRTLLPHLSLSILATKLVSVFKFT